MVHQYKHFELNHWDKWTKSFKLKHHEDRLQQLLIEPYY